MQQNNSGFRILVALCALVIGLMLFSTGCASRRHSISVHEYGVITYAAADLEQRGKKYQPGANQSAIYVVRQEQFVGKAAPLEVWVDEEKMAMMSIGSFIIVPVDPGEHKVSSLMLWKGLTKMNYGKRLQAVVDCPPGEKVFFLMTVDTSYFKIRQIPVKQGEQLIQNYDMIVANKKI